MSERLRPPERLRAAIVADLAPVKPLPPPARRALEVALWGVLALLLAPTVFGVRHDAALLGIMLTWGAAALEAAAGVLVVVLALREAIPAAGLGRSRAVAAMVAGVAVQGAVALLTWMGGPSSDPTMLARHSGATCLAMQSLLALPALAITVVLVLRALPLRPPWAGALAGLGAGLIADGAWHLVCPLCGLTHLLVWHGGATGLMVGAGWAGGVAWQRRRRRGIDERLRTAR
jgi:hypothetical protein